MAVATPKKETEIKAEEPKRPEAPKAKAATPELKK